MIQDIPALALDWHRAGRGAVLATVIQTWGSAPRRAGSQLVVDASGAIEGSVSGGCVEGAVVLEAQDALRDGQPRVLEYGVADDDAFAVGLACGGTIRILVEPVGTALPEPLLAQLVAARAARQPVAYVRPLDGAAALAHPPAYGDRFAQDRSGLEGDIFVGIHAPPVRVVIVGAVHIAQALAPMARMCGHEVIIVDPRPAFGAAARFPDDRLMDDWPDEALAQIGLDTRTAVVTLTHDPKLDDPAVRAALASDVAYIGCLGSRKTHAKRLARLADAPGLDRLRAPVGLGIGAQGPAEIAVSVLAEITAVLRLGPDAFPRAGSGPAAG